MKHTDTNSVKPATLVLLLISTSSIVGYRVAGFLADLFVLAISEAELVSVDRNSAGANVFCLVIGLAGAIGLSYGLCYRMQPKSRQAKVSLILALALLAVFPATFEVVAIYSPSPSITKAELGIPESIQLTVRCPSCAAADGLVDDVVLRHQDFVDAQVYLSPENEFKVRLTLGKEGQQRLSEVTARHMGKSIEYYFDTEKVSDVVINEHFQGDRIMLPIVYSRDEASAIADAIMKFEEPGTP
jgi:hypothetical protein